ncbi:MAG TPA: DUF423 domain-containing protein [Pseudogracilibacillus sp.]|nr:DUF423 domain-containing protein [Pseudogracilibacillus sp.]
MKVFLIIGAIFGFLAVSFGAFGAHLLEGNIDDAKLKTWEKAVNYQMFHTLPIILAGLLLTKAQLSSLVWAGWLFVLGTVLFSGSLYLYSTTGTKFLAMITPFGGITFLVAWVFFGYGLTKVLESF